MAIERIKKIGGSQVRVEENLRERRIWRNPVGLEANQERPWGARMNKATLEQFERMESYSNLVC